MVPRRHRGSGESDPGEKRNPRSQYPHRSHRRSQQRFHDPFGNAAFAGPGLPVPKLPEKWYTDGVKIISWEIERPIPGAKSIDYISASLALKKAAAEGAVESLYIDRNGLALECTTSNIFAFFGGRLATPGRGILSGVTRKVVLTLAEELFPIDIRDISRDELLSADEVFITGTSKGLVPVVQVDDGIIGDGRPGRRTRQLMAEMRRHTEAH